MTGAVLLLLLVMAGVTAWTCTSRGRDWLDGPDPFTWQPHRDHNAHRDTTTTKRETPTVMSTR